LVQGVGFVGFVGNAMFTGAVEVFLSHSYPTNPMTKANIYVQ